MAAPRPKGAHTSTARRLTRIVPTTSGSTPKEAGANRGAHAVPDRKSAIDTSPKNSSAGSKRARMIPTVVATERSAQRARTPFTTSSPQRRRAARSRTGSGAAVRSCVDTSLRCLLLAVVDRGVVLARRLGELLLRQRDEARPLRDPLLVQDDVADEGRDHGLAEGIPLRIDEERPGERPVGPVLHGRDAGSDAAVSSVHLQHLEPVLVLHVVRVAEVAQRASAALDPAHGDVVVFGR